jgi:hypothetical protein
LLTGREASLADYLQAANTLKRLLATLGLKRQPRDVTPDPLARRLLRER